MTATPIVSRTLLLCALLASAARCAPDALAVRAQPGSVIMHPRSGTLITTRESFPVTVSIPTFDADRQAHYHYWVSLAEGHDVTPTAKHWPKFSVKRGQYTANIYDGSTNPRSTEQPMTILLLRVDDGTNQAYDAWLERGGAYVAFTLNKTEVAAKVPIRFP